MNSLIKIAFLNLNAYAVFNQQSKASIGGTEIQLFNIANHLVKKNELEVSFIVGNWGQNDIENYNKIKIYKANSLKKNIKNYLIAPFLIWNKLGRINADIYIASSASMEVGLLAFFCKIRNKKFIYRTAHDIDCNREFVKKNGIIGKIFEYGLKNASKIVVQSKRNAEMIQYNYKIKPEIIHNSYEINSRDINKKNFVLWVGRCQYWKNPEMFLDIARKMPEIDFVMISPKQKNEIRLYNQITKDTKEIKNLKFIEGVPFNKIQKYFDEARIFVGTSEYEGFPNTYIQACLGMTPVVSYKVNPDNFITNNELGYCCDEDEKLVIERIKKLISNNDDWGDKSKKAFNYVGKNHNIEIEGEKWKSIILNIVKK